MISEFMGYFLLSICSLQAFVIPHICKRAAQFKFIGMHLFRLTKLFILSFMRLESPRDHILAFLITFQHKSAKPFAIKA
jgi:hypothetical protein